MLIDPAVNSTYVRDCTQHISQAQTDIGIGNKNGYLRQNFRNFAIFTLGTFIADDDLFAVVYGRRERPEPAHAGCEPEMSAQVGSLKSVIMLFSRIFRR